MLKEEIRQRLLAERGIHVAEACDKCGKLLGAARYTRKGDSGTYCSPACRGDGEWPATKKATKTR